MKTKKILVVAFAAVMAGAILSACGSKQESSVTASEEFVPCNGEETCTLSEHHPYIMGRLEKFDTELNAVYSIYGQLEDNMDQEDKDIYWAADHNTALHKTRESFTDAQTMLLALQSNKIDVCYVPEFFAQYAVSRNDNMHMWVLSDGTSYAAEHGMEIAPAAMGVDQQGYCMATLPDNTDLRERLNGALETLRTDGMLDTLAKKYITDCIAGDDPVPASLPEFPGKDTISVAVTGDLAPMDYVSADGQPAGYNVALLSEISKLLEVNIKLVSVTSDARLTALTSKLADVVFWSNIPDVQGWDRKDPGEVLLTDFYYKTSEAYLYTDYPLEFLMRYEAGMYSPDYLEKMIAA